MLVARLLQYVANNFASPSRGSKQGRTANRTKQHRDLVFYRVVLVLAKMGRERGGAHCNVQVVMGSHQAFMFICC